MTVKATEQATDNAFTLLDRRRFRANVYLDGEGEDALVGTQIAVSNAVLDVDMRIGRCVMTTRPQAGGVDRNLDVLPRSIANVADVLRSARSSSAQVWCKSAMRSHQCRDSIGFGVAGACYGAFDRCETRCCDLSRDGPGVAALLGLRESELLRAAAFALD